MQRIGSCQSALTDIFASCKENCFKSPSQVLSSFSSEYVPRGRRRLSKAVELCTPSCQRTFVDLQCKYVYARLEIGPCTSHITDNWISNGMFSFLTNLDLSIVVLTPDVLCCVEVSRRHWTLPTQTHGSRSLHAFFRCAWSSGRTLDFRPLGPGFETRCL